MRLTEKDRDMCHMRRRIHATDRDRRRRTETDREAVTVQAPPNLPPSLSLPTPFPYPLLASHSQYRVKEDLGFRARV
jgi:hypothetical protein